RHGLDAVRLHRLDGLAVARFRAPAYAQHDRLGGTVNVGVEHADARAFRCQPERQVDRGRALAHAPLAPGDSHDVLDAGHELYAALHRVRDDLHLDVDAHPGGPGEGLQLARDLLADGLDLAFRRIAQQDLRRNTVAIDLDIARRFTRNEVFLRVG